MFVSPRAAMVLAAGLGTRMRPLTDTMPKPMVSVAGKPLLDYALDKLAAMNVERAVVNVHYLADQIERHVAARDQPKIVISDERDTILGTGGAVVKALPELGPAPFFHLNADTTWLDAAKPNLQRMAEAFDPRRSDALLLLAPTTGSIGYDGSGDYTITADGLQRAQKGETAPFVFAGAAILSPTLFEKAPGGAFSLTMLFDHAAAAHRLHGIEIDGLWMHVGTPQAIGEAEAAIARGL